MNSFSYNIIYTIMISIASISMFPISQDLYNPMENPDMFGGDMIGVNSDQRNAVPTKDMLWPNRNIYYVVDESLSGITKLLYEAMSHFHENTCIRFKPWTNQTVDYVVIYYGSGCFSDVGHVGGQQVVSLGSGCDWFKTVVHELMHSVGFYHEQNRSDRDNYIKINYENINETDWPQFVLLKQWENLLLTDFDFESVMLYGPTSFSKNGKITMESIKPGKTVHDFPANKGLSSQDIYRINKLYGCI